MKITATATLMAAASATTYFSEDFNSGLDKWTQSETKDAGERGEFTTEAGAFYGDEKNLKLKTSQDARHYHLTAKLDTPVENKGKTLVVQYSVKNELLFFLLLVRLPALDQLRDPGLSPPCHLGPL